MNGNVMWCICRTFRTNSIVILTLTVGLTSRVFWPSTVMGSRSFSVLKCRHVLLMFYVMLMNTHMMPF